MFARISDIKAFRATIVADDSRRKGVTENVQSLISISWREGRGFPSAPRSLKRSYQEGLLYPVDVGTGEKTAHKRIRFLSRPLLRSRDGMERATARIETNVDLGEDAI